MIEERYMRRCLELAALGSGYVAPNPMVGAVLVHEGKIISEGYHREFGGNHAEIDAIKRLDNAELLKHSTLYVNLEPCSHYGKTPPCSLRIIELGIPKVVIGSIDPNPVVAGKGVELLQNAGIEVHIGVCETECRTLNRKFYHQHEQQKPWITLKWAETANGIMGKERYEQASERIISNELSQRLAHKLRTEHQAILVGRKTVQTDNPQLNVRYWQGNDPLRIVLDPNNWIQQDHFHILNDGKPTLLLTRHETSHKGSVKRVALGMDFSIEHIMSICHNEGVQSILIEGGAHTLNEFIDSEGWNEAWVMRSSFEWEQGIPAPHMGIKPHQAFNLSSDRIYHYLKT